MKNRPEVLVVLDQPIAELADLIKRSTAPSASVLRTVVTALVQEVDLKNQLAERGRQSDRGLTEVGGRVTGYTLDERIAEHVELLSDFIVSSASVRGQRALLRAVITALIEALKSEDRLAGAERRCHEGAGAPITMTLTVNKVQIESLRNLFEVVREGRDEPLEFRFLEDGAEVLVLYVQEQRTITAEFPDRDGIPCHVPDR
jgi:hypothetical protein